MFVCLFVLLLTHSFVYYVVTVFLMMFNKRIGGFIKRESDEEANKKCVKSQVSANRMEMSSHEKFRTNRLKNSCCASRGGRKNSLIGTLRNVFFNYEHKFQQKQYKPLRNSFITRRSGATQAVTFGCYCLRSPLGRSRSLIMAN